MNLIPLSLVVLAGMTAVAAQAAEDDALRVLRSAIAPSECSDKADIISQSFGEGQLHQISCRATFADLVYVMVYEVDGDLTPLFFPTHEFTLEPDTKTGGKPYRVHRGRIVATPLVTSPEIHAGFRVISTRQRIAPGIADGQISHSYQINHAGPELLDAYVDIETEERIWLWPPQDPADQSAGASLLEQLGADYELEGFAPLDTPALTLKDPREIAEHLDLDFPNTQAGEEGRARIEIAMHQLGTKVSATILSRGWADDSVEGRAFRVLMEQRGDVWAVTALGAANLCYRGETRVSQSNCP